LADVFLSFRRSRPSCGVGACDLNGEEEGDEGAVVRSLDRPGADVENRLSRSDISKWMVPSDIEDGLKWMRMN
jgi:hypothetical protein